MHLLVPYLPYPVPIVPSPLVGLQRETTIDLKIPFNDPRARALVPGMQVTMVNDEDHEQLVILGKGWITIHKDSVMRIPYSDVPTEKTSL